MASKIKDTDYLAISARIKAMETGLLTRERMEQVLEARSDEEAVKILQECGYPELDARSPEAMDAALSAAREATLSDVLDGAPDPRYIDIFKLKYDYHNIKAVLKAAAMNVSPDSMLMDMGRVPASLLKEAVLTGRLEELPEGLAAAAAEAREILDSTRDPQLSDIALDRRCYQEMARVAEETGSAFLAGYVKIQIDAANLRSLVRTARMGKSGEFLKTVLLEGGDIGEDAVAAAGNSGALQELYGPTALQAAAEAGTEALRGGSLTAFEKLCDDAVTAAAGKAKGVPFGVEAVIGYLVAKEIEFTAVRIIMSSRMAGIEGDTIRERLREAYV